MVKYVTDSIIIHPVVNINEVVNINGSEAGAFHPTITYRILLAILQCYAKKLYLIIELM